MGGAKSKFQKGGAGYRALGSRVPQKGQKFGPQWLPNNPGVPPKSILESKKPKLQKTQYVSHFLGFGRVSRKAKTEQQSTVGGKQIHRCAPGGQKLAKLSPSGSQEDP